MTVAFKAAASAKKPSTKVKGVTPPKSIRMHLQARMAENGLRTTSTRPRSAELMKVDTTITAREAYAAMFAFLEAHYQRTKSDDIGALLGGMSLLKDGETADPAVWTDWEEALRRVREEEGDIELHLE